MRRGEGGLWSKVWRWCLSDLEVGALQRGLLGLRFCEEWSGFPLLLPSRCGQGNVVAASVDSVLAVREFKTWECS